jgi:NAD(P)-dependent dehydrogenase (short-subunit alcohol dehydrogenase family)
MYGIPNKSIRLLPGALLALSGKNFCVVGGTAGIGQALARLAASNGSDVTVVGRTFRDSSVKNVSFVQADLNLMSNAASTAANLSAEKIDYLAFTNGIVPGNKRIVTSEGVEQDMAVSALSRWVMLKTLLPRLKPTTRIFIWGFPGTKGLFKQISVADFNSERSFSGGFAQAHMNTVALNEALVHHLAAQGKEVYGLNPGLIKTGIRDSVHGGGMLGGVLESVINVFNPTADAYVSKLLPVLLSPDLSAHKGIMLGQGAEPILATPEFTPSTVSEWIGAADALAAKALASK